MISGVWAAAEVAQRVLFYTMARVGTQEKMDDPNVDPAQLEKALVFIRSVNKRHGGIAASISAVSKQARRIPATETIRILDVATGSADIPLAIAHWAKGASRRVEITAVDNHPTTLNLAQAHLAGADADLASRVTLARGDARRLTDDFDAGSFHIVHTAMFLHHLPEIELLTVLRVMDRLASHALIAADILASPISSIAIKLMTLTKPEIIKHDARVSVENGFTSRELKDFAKRVGLESPRVSSSFLSQRLVLTSEKQA